MSRVTELEKWVLESGLDGGEQTSHFIELLEQAKLEQEYKRLVLIAKQAMDNVAAFRKEAAKICLHPEEYVESYVKNNDDGYGYWWKTYEGYCRICGTKFRKHGENDPWITLK